VQFVNIAAQKAYKIRQSSHIGRDENLKEKKEKAFPTQCFALIEHDDDFDIVMQAYCYR